MDYNFPVTRTQHPKKRPEDETKLGFAKYFTDHMFVMDYDEGLGWHDGRVVPHEPILIEPASCVLHYAQMMFEGMKAYRTPSGEIQLFRPDMNAKRMARTNERMCIPELPEELLLAGVKAVIKEDIDWVPSAPGTALYIRPFIFGDEVSFSVSALGYRRAPLFEKRNNAVARDTGKNCARSQRRCDNLAVYFEECVRCADFLNIFMFGSVKPQNIFAVIFHCIL